MIVFLTTALIVIFALLGLTIAVQFLSNYKIVGANEVAIVAGKGKDGYRIYRGGRVVVWPLFNRRYDLDLRPLTVQVHTNQAIAKGMVPLDVEATITVAISSSGDILRNAVQRLLELAQDSDRLQQTVSDIVEGHLRDGISTMTPEEVMRDKEALVKRMLADCRRDLQALGLELLMINVSDLADHRLEGMDNKELYIALLNRVQSTNAESQARVSQSVARAEGIEASEENRATLQERRAENAIAAIDTQTSAKLAEINRDRDVRTEEARRSAEAQEAGIQAEIAAEKERVHEVGARLHSEIVKPAFAERDRLITTANTEAAKLKADRIARIEQLHKLASSLESGGREALRAYIMYRLQDIVAPMTHAMKLFPAQTTNLVLSSGQNTTPLSATVPNPTGQAIANAKAGSLGVLDDSRTTTDGSQT